MGFGEAPFARHGGLPGTTARLDEWLTVLAASANTGKMDVALLSYIMKFLQAPVPTDSESAWSQATGRCNVCLKRNVEVPGRDLCERCLAVRRDMRTSPNEWELYVGNLR